MRGKCVTAAADSVASVVPLSAIAYNAGLAGQSTEHITVFLKTLETVCLNKRYSMAYAIKRSCQMLKIQASDERRCRIVVRHRSRRPVQSVVVGSAGPSLAKLHERDMTINAK